MNCVRETLRQSHTMITIPKALSSDPYRQDKPLYGSCLSDQPSINPAPYLPSPLPTPLHTMGLLLCRYYWFGGMILLYFSLKVADVSLSESGHLVPWWLTSHTLHSNTCFLPPFLLKQDHDKLTASQHEESLFCCSYCKFID